MRPSRRTILSVSGTTVFTLISGCTAIRLTENDPTPDVDVSDDAPFHVKLVGPETDKQLFSGSDVTSVGSIQEARAGGYTLPIKLSESATREVEEIFQSAAVGENPDQFEIVQYYGPEVTRFAVGPGFADAVVTGEWDGALQLRFEDRTHAEEIQKHMNETSSG
jgi:hypothetical protein